MAFTRRFPAGFPVVAVFVLLALHQLWTLAGGAVPKGRMTVVDLAVDKAGNVYVSDVTPCQVRRISVDGQVSIVAGTGTCGFSGDGGPAVSAELNHSEGGLAFDSMGNLYIGDSSNSRIRKVAPNGIISTVAGNGANSGEAFGSRGDGSKATAVPLGHSIGIAVDAANNLFIANNGAVSIREVNAAGIISTFLAGTGLLYATPAAIAAAPFNALRGMAIDAVGNLYVSDRNRIRKITPAGSVTTVAGTGTGDRVSPGGFSGDGGSATSAQINNPTGVTVDAAGNLYIADTGNDRVRKVNTAGIISTIAGTGTNAFSGDGGPASSASLSRPTAVAVDTRGNVYIADNGNSRVRKIASGGIISSIAANSTGGARGRSALAMVGNHMPGHFSF